jgi:hypothetical protein
VPNPVVVNQAGERENPSRKVTDASHGGRRRARPDVAEQHANLRHWHAEIQARQERATAASRRRHGGIHWPAIIAQALGMVASLMWINAEFAKPSYLGPISNHFPGLQGSDFSWAIGILVGAGVYYLLGRRGVRQEAGLGRAP